MLAGGATRSPRTPLAFFLSFRRSAWSRVCVHEVQRRIDVLFQIQRVSSDWGVFQFYKESSWSKASIATRIYHSFCWIIFIFLEISQNSTFFSLTFLPCFLSHTFFSFCVFPYGGSARLSACVSRLLSYDIFVWVELFCWCTWDWATMANRHTMFKLLNSTWQYDPFAHWWMVKTTNWTSDTFYITVLYTCFRTRYTLVVSSMRS